MTTAIRNEALTVLLPQQGKSGEGIAVDRYGRPLVVTTPGSGSATATALTTVSPAGITTVILAANTSRKGATIYNDSAATTFVALAATASATAYTVQLVQNAYYEVPAGYTGVISGITSGGTATLRVTEIT